MKTMLLTLVTSLTIVMTTNTTYAYRPGRFHAADSYATSGNQQYYSQQFYPQQNYSQQNYRHEQPNYQASSPIVIRNPSHSSTVVESNVMGQKITLKPGETHQFHNMASCECSFHSGGSAGNRRYTLVPGTYEFHSTEDGWNLHKAAVPPIVVWNPSESSAAVEMDLLGQKVTLKPGEVHRLADTSSSECSFNSGGAAGNRRYQLSQGTYKFQKTDEGWNLYKTEDHPPTSSP